MNDVYFYNFSFEPLEQLSGFVSLNATTKYCGFGTVEIHLPISKTEIIGMLRDNPHIICLAKDVQMIVTGWRLGEDIAIFGRTPEWLLTKRVIAPFEQTQKMPAEIAYYAVQTAADDFVEVTGELPVSDKIDYSAKEPKTVYDVLCGVLKPAGLGFKLEGDMKGKKFNFSVYRGRELSLLISASNRTAFDMQYICDMQDAIDNCGWYQREMVDMGQWDASKNSPKLTSGKAENFCKFYKITTAYTRFGLNCTVGAYLYCDTEDGVWKVTDHKPDFAWVYIDNSTTIGAARWEGILKGVKLPDEAMQDLADMKVVEKSETALRHVEYGTDYTQGDVVRVQTQFGEYKRTERKRVTSVEIFYDTNAVGTKPTFESLKE